MTIERAGFWRRMGAFLIDTFVVALLLELVALAAFPISNGHIQASLGLQTTHCRRLPEASAAFKVPPTFEANFASDCRVSLLGLQTAHTVTIGRQTREGNVTKSVAVSFMVDDQGEPIRGLSLNVLLLPLLVVLRWRADQRTGSPGRRIWRLVVVDAAMPDAAPSRAALTRRYAAFALPSLPLALFSGYDSVFPSFSAFDQSTFIPVWIALSLVVVAELWAIGSIVRKEDTFYDRFAATVTRRHGA